MYSLTLVERDTCPRTCHHWNDCYGDNMPFAHRFALKGLTPVLEAEIAALVKKHREGIVIRLHVLGDFASVSYVKFWGRMLKTHPTLALFGYTGRDPDSTIGGAIDDLNENHPAACAIRFSQSKAFANNQRFAAEEGFSGECFTCPEQLGKVASCADCGLCWITDKTVRFLTH